MEGGREGGRDGGREGGSGGEKVSLASQPEVGFIKECYRRLSCE